MSTVTSSTNFEAVIAAALEEYKRKTKKDIASHPLAAELKSCESPSAVLSILQAQIQTFDKSRSTDEMLTRWLDPTVNVLYAFSAILGDAVGLVFPPSSAIFAGIGILFQAVKDVRASEDALIDLFCRMECLFKRLEKHIKVRPTAALTDVIVKIMVEVLSILGIVTKEIGQGKLKKFFKKLAGMKDLEDALQRLDKLTRAKAFMAAAEGLTITREIGNRVEDADDNIGSVDEGVKENQAVIKQVVNQVSDLKRNELRKDLRRWIAPPDPSVNFHSACDAHHEGTTAWWTTVSNNVNWKDYGSLLWIHGKPGSGKTILSSVIIRDIKTMSAAGKAFLAYFYFDFKDTEKQDSRALLSSLLVQLSDHSDVFFDILFSLYSAHKEGSEKPANDSMVQCLKKMVTTTGQAPIYIIIDALDECPNDSGIPSPREKVLDLVKELDRLWPRLRLCITSRPDFDIHTALEFRARKKISLHDESGQKQDIINYVTSVVHSDRNMMRWPGDDKNMVIEKLSEGADGMFRWVFCQLEVLRHCFPSNLRHILKELPKSLDETYKRVLKDINNANREHAYRLLQCLAVACRPLRVEELAEVLAFDPTEGVPKPISNSRWGDREEAVLSACSSLVSVINDHGFRVVQFSHFSVKEFLTSERLTSYTEAESRFHIPIEPSHTILAKACLGVLLCLDGQTDEGSAMKIPLFRYAAKYWHQHARIGNVELGIADTMDCFFDSDKPHFSAWVRLQGRNYLGIPTLIPIIPSNMSDSVFPLCVAVGNGFHGLVERLITKHPHQVNHSDDTFGTPLHASVIGGGHIKIAQLLFEHGADTNSQTLDSETPLLIASRLGDVKIGEWLLDHGADVNRQMKDGKTSLYLAAEYGHVETARLLLERHAKVNSQKNDRSTPLLVAVQKKKEKVAHLLLEYGADPNVRDKFGNTPLHVAVSNGHFDVAQKLLDLKAKVNIRDGKGRGNGSTPLHYAARDGNLNAVRLLLGYGAVRAGVHPHDESGNTPLHLAVHHGHFEVARELLKLNVEVNSRNDNGCTPLHYASENGNPDVVWLLLGYGADVRACGKSGKTPLHFAAHHGHLEVARGLLELKTHFCAKVDSRDRNGSTPLHYASQNGNLDVVRLLLDHRADVHACDKSERIPLHLAMSHRTSSHLEVARKLLELSGNVQVNSRDNRGFLPLHNAYYHGNLDAVLLLLDHHDGAELDACVLYDGKTPLHIAASYGRFDIARKLLLKFNAGVNSRDDDRYTPLHRALQNGNCDVAWLLLDHDADVHVRSRSGKNPLHFAAAKGDLEVARKLLELNAEVDPRDDGGYTPLHHALQNGNRDVAWLLLDHDADVHVRSKRGENPLHLAAENGDLEFARKLLELNAEVNPRDDEGSTPLLMASGNANGGVLQLLLDHNADVNVHDHNGNTPLHRAALSCRLEVARILLKHGVEINARNAEGSTPLHLAAGSESRQNRGKDFVQLLLDYGADVQACNLSGQTASDRAFEALPSRVWREVDSDLKLEEIVQLLSQHAT